MNPPMISNRPMMMNQIPTRTAIVVTDEVGTAVTTIPAIRLTIPKKNHQPRPSPGPPEMAVASEITPASGLVARPLEGDPSRTIALVWRRTSARKAEFRALGLYLKSVLSEARR